jgi:ribonuclease R
MHELEDDYYEFHEDKYALIGRNTGRRYRLADPMRVRVASVNKASRQIDFELVRPVKAEEKKPLPGKRAKEGKR